MGGNDGWAGMADGVALRKVAFSRMAWLCEACHSRESGNLETFATGTAGIGRVALDSWSPIGVGDELRGNDGGAVDSRFRGNDRWAGMVVGGNGGWVRMTDAVALRKVAFSRMLWLCETRHSRESGNLEAFATGRLALDGRPWIPGPRSGSGTSFGE